MRQNPSPAPFLKSCSKAILVIGSICLSLVAAEALGRLFLWKSQQTYGSKIHDNFYFDRNGVSRIRPNTRGWHRGYDEQPILVEINSDGFRGPEVRSSPAQRIIFIGDSIVFDGGVQQEETFIALLEDKFEKDGHRVEIINAGTTDVGVKQYLLQAKHSRFERYEPDLIVIGLYLNDSRPSQGFLGENQDKIFNIFSHFLLNRLALTHYIKQGYIAMQYKRGKKYSGRFNWIPRFNSGLWKDDLEEFQQTVKEAQFDWGAAWNSSFEKIIYPTLMELRDLYVKTGAKFAVVLFPVSLQVQTNLTDPFIDIPQRQLSMFANEAGIPFFDLLPDLRAYRGLWPFADHAHLNRKGNQIVADIIYPFLKDRLVKKTEKGMPL